jgi:serine/threonine-protein kinase
VHLLRQLCGALSEAHAVGLIHRDVKPDNVLLCRLGGSHDVVKLFDFGLVQIANRDAPSAKLTQVGLIVGTPEYMSPEQVSGAEIDLRTDLFSLGAVAYFLLTGACPYSGENTLALMYARLREGARPPSEYRSDVPVDVERIILRCLAREKADRFADARELERALAGCACAREWNDESAAEWWNHEATDGPDPTRSARSTLRPTSHYPPVTSA